MKMTGTIIHIGELDMGTLAYIVQNEYDDERQAYLN